MEPLGLSHTIIIIDARERERDKAYMPWLFAKRKIEGVGPKERN